MADVFLSYKREDQGKAREIAADLETEGFSVFFDVAIEVGDSWDERIEAELNAAKAVVVLWSPKARESKWVKREAREALARGILCPALIARCKVPLEFSDVQAADIVGRRAHDHTHPEWRRLMGRVERCVGRKARGAPAAPQPTQPKPPPSKTPPTPPANAQHSTPLRNRRALIVGGAAAGGAAVIAGGYYGWTRVRAEGVQRAWEEARAAGTRRAVNAFLREHPNAPQVQEARDVLARLPIARETAVLAGHENFVQTVAFSPDGALIATASWDRTARIWNANTGDQARVLAEHSGFVNGAAFSPDGERLLTWSWDVANHSDQDDARVWDVGTGQQLAQMLGHETGIGRASFSPDGALVATASQDKTARVWDSATGRQIAILRHEEAVWSAVFDLSSTRIVTASSDHTARIWDARSGRELGRLQHEAEVSGGALFSQDGARIITSSFDGQTRVWDTAELREVRSMAGYCQDVSADGARIVTSQGGGPGGRVWDAATGRQIATLAAGISRATFSPDGRRIVTMYGNDDDFSPRLWDVATGAELDRLHGHQTYVTCAGFSPGGGQIVTGSQDHTARIWEIDEEA